MRSATHRLSRARVRSSAAALFQPVLTDQSYARSTREKCASHRIGFVVALDPDQSGSIAAIEVDMALTARGRAEAGLSAAVDMTGSCSIRPAAASARADLGAATPACTVEGKLDC